MVILTQDQLVANNMTCPALGIAACDNAGECGMCLLELPPSLRADCPNPKSLPHCRAGNVEFGRLCEANGLSEVPNTPWYNMFACGTHREVNSCGNAFDVYVNVFCAGTSPQAPPPPPSPLPLAPLPPFAPPPLAPPTSPGEPPPAVIVGTPATQIIVAACIPVGFLVLFCMALLVYRAVRRRSSARVEQEHRDYQAKLQDISSEYNSSVLYAVKSLATYAHMSAAEGVEMSTVTPAKSVGARIGGSEDCAVCMEVFKEGDAIKVLPCRHTVRPAPGWSFSHFSLSASPPDVPTRL